MIREWTGQQHTCVLTEKVLSSGPHMKLGGNKTSAMFVDNLNAGPYNFEDVKVANGETWVELGFGTT